MNAQGTALTMNLVLGIVSSLLASALVGLLLAMRKRWGSALSDLSATLRLAQRLRILGVLHIFGSRSDYQKYRGTPTVIDYFRLAHKSVEMAAYWISYGVEAQGLAEEIGGLLSERPSLSVTLAIIDPKSTHLDALSKHLNRSTDEVRDRIIKSLTRLTNARADLPDPVRSRYHIKMYDSLPVASVIMLDRGELDGRIQVDIKPYHAAQHNSFAIEFTHGSSPLYQHISEGWGQLIADARELQGIYVFADQQEEHPGARSLE